MLTHSLKNKKVIVFDLDGTVIKLSADWSLLKDILIDKFKEYYGEDCNVKRISSCLNEVVQRGDETILQDFFDIIREFELESVNQAHPIKETVNFIINKELFGIKKEAKFAILSLNTRKTIITALELASITNKIDYIVGREDVRKWKPAPDGLFKIKKHFNVKKKDMIFFGDLDNDLITGKNADIESYFIDDLIKLVNNKINKPI
ncbi:MAG: HAD family hydrolase [Promethearchaeota archaeon]